MPEAIVTDQGARPPHNLENCIRLIRFSIVGDQAFPLAERITAVPLVQPLTAARRPPD